MDVLIVRHGIAEPREEFVASGLPDGERPLTEKGRSRIRRQTQGMQCLVPTLDALASSPLVRAWQTAEIIVESYGGIAPRELAALSPGGDVEQVLAYLISLQREAAGRSASGPAVALVGHEPDLGELAGWLVTGVPSSPGPLRKGGVWLVSFHGDPAPGAGMLRWMLTPAALRGLRLSEEDPDRALPGWPASRGARFVTLSRLDDAGRALAALERAEAHTPGRGASDSDEGSTGEALHRFRVALRRLQSTLQAHKRLLGKGGSRKLRQRIRDLRAVTNPGRDAEVALDWLQTLCAEEEGPLAGLATLRTELEKERTGAYVRAGEDLGPTLRKVERRIRRRVSTYRAWVVDPDRGQTFGAATARVARRWAGGLVNDLAIMSSGDQYPGGPRTQAASHHARLVGKRLRYLLEPFGSGVPEIEALIDRLKDLQDRLGTLHDAQILGKRLAAGEWAGGPLADRNRARGAEIFDDFAQAWLYGRARPFFLALDEVLERVESV